MILFDWPLVATMALFYIISWVYGWGLLHFFRYEFHWDKAAVMGIASVTSITFLIVWTIRLSLLDYSEPSLATVTQFVWDLMWVFFAALPGMMKVREVLVADQRAMKAELKQLRQWKQSIDNTPKSDQPATEIKPNDNNEATLAINNFEPVVHRET